MDRGDRFRAVVRYGGVPETLPDVSGFFHTDDGMMVIGEPHVAATWFPVNDHPVDKAAYTFRIQVPKRLEVVANGVLKRKHRGNRTTTWVWAARAPMASYLATANVGHFDIHAYRRDGIRYWDAIDPDLFEPLARPRTGSRFAIAGRGSDAYKRLSRVIQVPADGARLAFWAKRDVEENFDFMFVEARPTGTGDWTTLPARRGLTTRGSGFDCQGLLTMHPFLGHYLTAQEQGCSSRGTTGRWNAATGTGDAYERWVIDLSHYAGQDVDVSISYVTDFVLEQGGVFIDDVVVSTGEGSTSFERDGNVMDGWTIGSAPPGSPGNTREWSVGTSADTPAPLGEFAAASFAKQDNILRFLGRRFGPYPFNAAGGIVDDLEQLGFALETQTRPIYAQAFFGTPLSGDLVVVHELAHQWYGNSIAVQRWRTSG